MNHRQRFAMQLVADADHHTETARRARRLAGRQHRKGTPTSRIAARFSRLVGHIAEVRADRLRATAGRYLR